LAVGLADQVRPVPASLVHAMIETADRDVTTNQPSQSVAAVSKTGNVTLRYRGRLHHIGIGNPHPRRDTAAAAHA
jgi:hypothetical protein